jgi:DNA-binding MarR family transcriptional regulator
LTALIVDGYVQVRDDPSDRRAVSISLTAKGRRARQRIFRRMQACESRICGALDERHMGELKNALQLLEAVL